VGVLAVVAAVGLVEGYSATRPARSRPLMYMYIVLEESTPLLRVDVGADGGNVLALTPAGARLALTLCGADGKMP
jgi:hypothetical protein